MWSARLIVYSSILIVCPCAFASDDIQTILLAGDRVPGDPDDGFVHVGRIRLSNSGELAFQAYTSDGTNEGTGIWKGRNGSTLTRIARAGDPAPDTNESEFAHLQYFDFNNSGEVAFHSELKGPAVDATNNLGVWFGNGEVPPRLVARSGDIAPGVPGAMFGNLGVDVTLNDAGDIYFDSFLRGTGITTDDDFSHWSSRRGLELDLVIREGDAVPGLDDVVFGDIGIAQVNDSRDSVGLAEVMGDGITRANDHIFWRKHHDRAVEVLARGGEPAPGADGLIFGGFQSPRMNESGQVAMIGFGTNSAIGVWRAEEDRQLRPVAARPDGQAFSCCLQLNDAGDVAFSGRITGDDGIWLSTDDGALTAVVLRGEHAPQMPNYVFGHQYLLSLNESSQVAFGGSIRVPIVDDFTPGGDSQVTSRRQHYGIWAQDRRGNLIPIALDGTELDVDDGPLADLRVVRHVSFEDMDDLGRIAFTARFMDGTSGWFVSHAAAVPEPGTASLLLILLCALGLIMRRFTPYTGH